MHKSKHFAKKLLPALLLALTGCVYPEAYSPYSTYGTGAAYPGYYPGSYPGYYPGYYDSGFSTTYIYGGSPYYYYPPNYRGREWRRERPPYPAWHHDHDHDRDNDHNWGTHTHTGIGGSTRTTVVMPPTPSATLTNPTPVRIGGGQPHHETVIHTHTLGAAPSVSTTTTVHP